MAQVGRPLKYKTKEELEGKIEEYFAKNKEHPTLTGLAYHLGFESRQSIYDYEERGEFSYTIKRARLFIESHYELRLYHSSPTGAIFALKNFGWKDSIEHDVTDELKEKLRKHDEMIRKQGEAAGIV